ncbi:helix-turn-helix domain-containing protein [Actinokineospora sp.]|uniref:helix-turn-helix domain-containing protein n=1 Tax=Actinokineospora sp. TaxID=1872133 RepID=UPI0040379E43
MIEEESTLGHARPTFERRQLGLTMRRLREQSGETQQAAADEIGKARSRIVQLEDGTATASQEDLATLLDFYGVTGEERETILVLGTQTRRRQQRRVHIDQLPDAYQRFADLEASAAQISGFEPGIIPGLLQSESYIRAILADGEGMWSDRSLDEVKDRFAYRIERQRRVLDSIDPPTLRFVITEDTLRANLGAPDIMQEQLDHLLTLAQTRRDLAIRVLRNDVAGNPARGHGFWIYGFGDRGAPIGISPSVISPSSYYDDERDVATLLRMFARLWELALSNQESVRLIKSISKEH